MFARLFLISFICLFSLSAEQTKIKVVTTTSIVADLLKEIAKDRIELQSLMGAGVDPHLYKASPSDLKLLREADLIFYNGLHLEGKLSEILAAMARNKKVVPVSSDISKEKLIHPEGYSDLPDPHIWFDVSLWIACIDVVRRTLSEALPDYAEEFSKNAQTYKKQLEDLDSWVRAELSTIPKARRILITAHDAFAYFGKAYDIEVRGLQGISTASEFGLYDVNDLANLIISKKVPSVFSEASVPERFISALVAGVEAKGAEVKFGKKLFSDALGDLGGGADTYQGMLRYNVHAIKEGLQ